MSTLYAESAESYPILSAWLEKKKNEEYTAIEFYFSFEFKIFERPVVYTRVEINLYVKKTRTEINISSSAVSNNPNLSGGEMLENLLHFWDTSDRLRLPGVIAAQKAFDSNRAYSLMLSASCVGEDVTEYLYTLRNAKDVDRIEQEIIQDLPLDFLLSLQELNSFLAKLKGIKVISV